MEGKRLVAAPAARCLVALAVIATAAACGDKTVTGPSETSAVPYALAISGDLALHQPGDVGQLTATATMTGGATKDVTRDAMWSCTCAVTAARIAAGKVTAVGYGKGEILVTYGTLRQSIPMRIAPEGAFLIEGTVTSAGMPMVADVEATSASGTYSTRSDAAGAFTLPGAGTVALRAESPGFQAQTRTLTVGGDEEVNLEIQSADYSSIRGAYTLTFTAAPSCDLPPQVMKQTWSARIEVGRFIGSNEDLVVTVDAPRIPDPWWGVPWTYVNGFTGTLDGKRVTFTIVPDPDFARYALLESVGDLEVSFEGRATGEASDRLISTVYDGTVRVYGSGIGRGGECTANNHRLEFTR